LNTHALGTSTFSPKALTTALNQLNQQLAGWPGQLVAVSKHAHPQALQQAYWMGLRHFGENTVQHWQHQCTVLPAPDVRWHLIGPLQRNKVTKCVGKVALIQSVDSIALAAKINQTAEGLNIGGLNICQPVLLQVNLAHEPQKHGFNPETLLAEYPLLLAMPHLAIKGLMGIAPQGIDEPQLTAFFTGLRGLRDHLNDHHPHVLTELSMGMSQDFDIARACGATIIRVGSRLFN
jgi:PLP dependent protein